MKVGTIIAPKKGSFHHKEYGDFVGKVEVRGGYGIRWSLLEIGNGKLLSYIRNEVVTTGVTNDFEDITEIYNSPLWKALG